MTKLLAGIALMAATLLGSACGRASDAGEVIAPVAAAAPAPSLAPDVEAESIPTANGIPLVPLTAPVNFLDALEPLPIYRMPAEYNTNHTAVQIIKEEETLQLDAYELGGLWLIGYGHLMLEGEKDTITEEEADAFLVERGGQEFLGEAGAAGVGDIARVDDAFDARIESDAKAGKLEKFAAAARAAHRDGKTVKLP